MTKSDGKAQFERFSDAVKKVVSVPKSVVLEQLKKQPKKRRATKGV